MLLLGAAAPAGAASADAQKSTDWRVSHHDDIDFDDNVFAAFNSTPYFIFTEVYETLLNLDESGRYGTANALTERFEHSGDNKVWTFHLRSSLRWSDGQPLTADDVVFSWEQGVNSNVNSGYVQNLAKVEKLDTTTVRLTFSRVDNRIEFMYVPIVPKHIWAAHTKDIAKFRQCCPTVGSGPFQVTKLDEKGTTILEPNPYYHGPTGEVKRVLIIKYGDEEAELRDLRLGHLDAVLSGNDSWVRTERKTPNVKIWPSPAVGFEEVAFNSCPPGGKGSSDCTGPDPSVAVKVVQDRAIRKALAWAIDRQSLVRLAYHGVGSPGNGLISPAYRAKGYYKDWSKDPVVGYHYDPAKARQILRDGGWQCPAHGICSKNGTNARFELLVRASNEEDKNAARRIVAWARDVGIAIDTQIATEDAISNRIYKTSPKDENKYQPSYDAFMWDWVGDVAAPDYVMSILKCSTSGSSDSYYCNPAYDKLVDAALSTTDFRQRVDLLHRAERMVLDDAPYVFTIHTDDIYATRTDTWTGYRPFGGPDGQPFAYTTQQLQWLKAGARASTSYAGAWVVLGLFTIAIVLVAGVAAERRRREESGPLELDPPPLAPQEAMG